MSKGPNLKQGYFHLQAYSHGPDSAANTCTFFPQIPVIWNPGAML